MARACNKSGHFVVASIAYDQLAPATKMRIDALLAQHPDFPKWTHGVPATQQGKVAFVKAAGWPDDIKGDPRFFDPDMPPTDSLLIDPVIPHSPMLKATPSGIALRARKPSGSTKDYSDVPLLPDHV